MPGRFDPVELLRVLTAHDVRFVVVGGVAGTLAGSPIATRDLDLVYETSRENLDRLVEALVVLGSRYKDPAGRVVEPDTEKLLNFRVNLLTTDQGDLDLLRNIGAGLEYADLLPRTIEYDLGGLRIRAIDLETLIESKAFADRPKDRYALPFLQELLRLRRSRDEESS
jgi:predicted nucleotidyltransferase